MKDDRKQFIGACNYAHKQLYNTNMPDDVRFEFSEYLHDLKSRGYKGKGKNGDYTFHELVDKAKGFLEAMEKRKKK